jgi:surface antigen
MDPTNPNHLVCALFGLVQGTGNNLDPDGGLYYTDDALAVNPKFTKVTSLPQTQDGNLPFQTNVKLAFSPDGLTVLAATGELDNAQTDQGVLRKSTDGGKTFPTILHAADGFAGGQGFYNVAIAIDQKNPLNVYLAGTVGSAGDGGIFQYSTDGGQTFTPSINSLHADSHAIAIAPSASNVIYTGDDGGVWGSTDSSHTWRDLNTEGFIATQFESVVVHPTDSNFTLGGTQDNGTILRRPDGTFFRVDFGDGGYALIDQSATDTQKVTMYHTYYNQTGNLIGFARVLKTSCAVEGEWSFRGAYTPPIDPTVHCDGTKDEFNGINLNDNVNFYAPMALGPGSPNTVYFGTDTLYRSANKGDTMPVVSQAPIEPISGGSGGVAISAIGISPTSDSIRVVGLVDGTVWATTTGSNTLVEIDGGKLPADYICRVVLDPVDPNTAYVTFNGYGLTAKPGEQIWVTHNLNAATPTWKPAGKGIPSISVNGFVIDPLNTKHLFAGTDHGVYGSTDGGVSWSQFGKGFPDVEIFDLTLQSPARILRAATHGLGIWEASIGF